MKRKDSWLHVSIFSVIVFSIFFFEAYNAHAQTRQIFPQAVDSKGDIVSLTLILEDNGASSSVTIYKMSGKNGSQMWKSATDQFADSYYMIGMDLQIDSKNDIFIKGIYSNDETFIAKFSGANGSKMWQIDRESFGYDLTFPSITFMVDKKGDIIASGVTSTSDTFFTKYRGTDGLVLWEKKIK